MPHQTIVGLTAELLEMIHLEAHPTLLLQVLLYGLRIACHPSELSLQIIGGSLQSLRVYTIDIADRDELGILCSALNDRIQQLERQKHVNTYADRTRQYRRALFASGLCYQDGDKVPTIREKRVKFDLTPEKRSLRLRRELDLLRFGLNARIQQPDRRKFVNTYAEFNFTRPSRNVSSASDFLTLGRKKMPTSRKKTVDFVLASKPGVPSRLSQFNHYYFDLKWDIHPGLIKAIQETQSKRGIIWCIDYDGTLFSTSQGRASYNHILLRWLQHLVNANSARILTSRTDPIYLLGLIKQLLRDPLSKDIFIQRSTFDRERFKDLRSNLDNVVKKLRQRYRKLKQFVPDQRRQLISRLIEYLCEITRTDHIDVSPWDVKKIPSDIPLDFLNEQIQLFVNDNVPHLTCPIKLKGEICRELLDSHKKVYLVDDQSRQIQSCDSIEGIHTFTMRKTMRLDIPYACQAFAEYYQRIKDHIPSSMLRRP